MTTTKGNRAALVLLVLIVVGLPALILGYQHGLRPALAGHRVVEITALAPENGGFSPDVVRVEVGETLTLRFLAADVTHGIAIGPGLGVDLGHIDPGHVGEVTITPNAAGIYTYYCNTWCSRDHWRMRGILEVVDPSVSGAIEATTDPIIEALTAAAVDIDSEPQPAEGISPDRSRGALHVSGVAVPPDLHDDAWRFSHSPADGLELLQAANHAVPEDVLVDVVAYLWSQKPPPAEIKELYAKNCAACHGEHGAGDGPVAISTRERPVAYPEAAWLRRSDVWYAKIRRGGMGTDMPNFGTIFTVEETRLLVDYLRYLSFAGS